jgi:hypothetical protein
VLAGSFRELSDAAARGARVSHAVYIVVEGHCPFTPPHQREELWEWFGVPSFVLVLDARGRLVAYECEAEDGYHVAATAGVDRVGQRLCACGRPGPRILISKERRSLPPVYSLTA